MPADDPHINGHVRHYIDARFADHQQQHEAEHRALDAASQSMSHRLEGMNEFRDSLRDAASTYVTREVLDITVRERNQRIDAIQAEAKGMMNNLRAEAQRAAIAAGVVGVVSGFILAILLSDLVGVP